MLGGLWRRVALLAIAPLLLLVWPTSVAEAAAFQVNAPADVDDANLGDGHCDIVPGSPGDQCSLRAAIREANALGGTSEIALPAGAFTLTLGGRDEDAAQTGDLDITANIRITGQGPRTTFIQASAHSQTSPDNNDAIDRVFDVQPGGHLALSMLTVRNGRAVPAPPATVSGGAIRNVGGSLTLTFAEVTDSRSAATTVSGSTSGGNGGGIANQTSSGTGGTFTATNVTIVANSGDGFGGGIVNNGTMTLTNVTLSGNVAKNGAGIGTNDGSSTLSFVTIAGNRASSDRGTGGLEAIDIPNILLRATLLSENQGGNCRGRMSSGGSNITDGAECFATPGVGDILDQPEEVSDLQDNGSLVRTHSPKLGDPAIDGVDPSSPAAAFCPAIDARNLARPQDGRGVGSPRCDIGAHEVRSFAVNLLTDGPDLQPGDNLCDVLPGAGGVQCSLRAAVQEANAHAEPIIIVIPAGSFPIQRGGAEDDTGSVGDLDIVSPHLAIIGAGADQTVVDGHNLNRVFDIQPGADVRMSRLRITGGNSPDGDGGGIRVRGSLALSDASVDHNAAVRGGGLAAVNAGSFAVDRTTVQSNVAAHGGGIAVDGSQLGLHNSTVATNQAFIGGGGLYLIASPSSFVQNVTISGNSNVFLSAGGTPEGGGGIQSDNSLVELVNVTLADNHAERSTGASLGPAGLLLAGGRSLKTTLGIIGPNGLTNGQRISPECGGVQGPSAARLRTTGGNVAADSSCSTLTRAGDRLNVDPLLAPLAPNGGPTQTHALLIGSPAIDRVGFTPEGGFCGTTDQRGLPRPVNAGGGLACDSGAFELQPGPCAPRPPVQVSVVRVGGGRVQATITVVTTSTTPVNSLSRIDFGPTTRASLDLGQGGPPTRGNVSVPLSGPRAFTFTIIPDGPGVSNLAPFVAFDQCGAWRSFAGAGSSATGSAAASGPTNDQGPSAPAPAPSPIATPETAAPADRRLRPDGPHR
jgi:CSLREA domain-containing protein